MWKRKPERSINFPIYDSQLVSVHLTLLTSDMEDQCILLGTDGKIS